MVIRLLPERLVAAVPAALRSSLLLRSIRRVGDVGRVLATVLQPWGEGSWRWRAWAARLSGLDTAVNIAFPAITAAFDLDPVQIQWVIVAYVLSYATLLLPLGRLADRVGHGRVLVLGLAVSAVGLAACSLAQVFVGFLVGRMVQGVGIGLVLASAPALVSLAASEEARPRALGVFQMAVSLGVAVGPPLGGLLVELADWRAVFWFRAPLAGLLCLAALAAGLWRAPSLAGRPPPLDLAGALCLGVGLGAVLVAARWSATWGWLSPTTLAVFGLGAAAIGLFVAIERRSELPLVDLGLLAVPSFALANALNLVANATMFVLWLLGPYLLVTVRGHGTIPGGLLFRRCRAFPRSLRGRPVGSPHGWARPG